MVKRGKWWIEGTGAQGEMVSMGNCVKEEMETCAEGEQVQLKKLCRKETGAQGEMGGQGKWFRKGMGGQGEIGRKKKLLPRSNE